MAAGYMIGDFDYEEINNNYDEIYDTLINGGTVWMHLDFYNTDAYDYYGVDGYMHFMVTNWCMTNDGLCIICPDGSSIYFPNGSHTPASSPK